MLHGLWTGSVLVYAADHKFDLPLHLILLLLLRPCSVLPPALVVGCSDMRVEECLCGGEGSLRGYVAVGGADKASRCKGGRWRLRYQQCDLLQDAHVLHMLLCDMRQGSVPHTYRPPAWHVDLHEIP